MISAAISIGAAIAVLAALYAYAARGFGDGDRPEDAIVTARLRDAGQPDEPRPVVVATVRNPSGMPVLVGLSVRRAVVPRWPGGGASVTVPHRTARRRLRPGAYETIGVVPVYGNASFLVPVRTSARGYLLTVAVGQAGGRLRLHRLLVTGALSPARTELTVPFGEGLFDLSRTNDGYSSQSSHYRATAPHATTGERAA
jgi:hypothetical protein